MDLKRRTLINTGAKYASVFSLVGVRFFLTPFLIATLGPRLLGLQTLSTQALGFVALVSSALGVSYRRHATASYAEGDYQSMNMYLGIGLWVSCLSALIFVLCAASVAWSAQHLFGLPDDLLFEARVVIAVTGLATAIQMVMGVFASPAFIRERLFIYELSSIVGVFTSAIGVWFAFTVGRPSIVVWVVLANGCRVGAHLLIALPWCRRLLPEMRINAVPKGARREFTKLFQFGGLSLIGGLGYLLFYSTDSVIISNLNELGIDKVLYYNLGQRWDPIVRMGIGALVMSLTPALISRYARGDLPGLRRILFKGTRYSLVIGLLPCILLVAYARVFLALWVGEDFATESGPVLQLIMSTMVVTIPGIMGYEALVAAGRLGVAATAMVVGGLLNIIISISLVKFAGLGLMGVAIGSVSMLTLKNALLTPWLVARYTQTPLASYLKEGYLRPLLAAVVFLPMVVLVRYTAVPASLTGLFVTLGACSLLYAPCVWLVALLPEERADAIHQIKVLLHRGRRDDHAD